MIFGKWTSTRWNHQTACLTLVLLQLSLFGDLLGPWGHGAVLSSSLGDLDQHFIAWRLFAANQLRHGILPLWTPAYLGGTPFLGGFESALFYPFNLLFLLFSFPVAANLEIFFQVWMAGFFSYGWAASRGWRPGACLLVACGVSWSGPFFLQVYAGHLSNLCAMAWIPPVVWALEEVMKKTSRRWGIVLAAGVGLQGLAGHPQYSYYTAMMILIYALILGWGDRARFQKWAVAATAYGFGGLLAMAQWLPGLQAVLESSRGRLDDFKTAGLFSLPPENVLTLFLPGFFGPVGSAQYWGRWYLWDVCLFVGWSLLFLCGYGLFRNRWRSPRELLMIGIAFLLAIGQSTPLFRLLFDYLPGYRSFRGTCKFDIFIVLFIVLLAGSGFDALTREKRSGKGPVKFLGAVAVVASLLGITIKISAARGLAGIWGSWLTSIHWLRGPLSRVGRSTLDHFARSAGLQSAESLFLLAATAVVLAGAVVWAGRNPKGWVVLGFVAVAELFIFARAHRPTFDGPARAQKFEQVQAFYQTHPGDYRVFGTGSDAALEGGRDLWDQEPLILSRYALFVSQSQGFPEEAIFRTSPIFTRFQPIYALTRLRYILNVDGAGRLKAMELPFKPFPQVKIYHQYVTVASASDAVGRLLSPGFDFKHRLILEQKPNPAPSKPTALESVSVQNRSVDRLDLEANLSAPGILLITDNYGLGWKAKDLNGTSASSFKVMPADGFLRAIALPAGQHRLALVYAPDSFRVGLWISLVALMFSIVILTCVFRRPLFPPIQRK